MTRQKGSGPATGSSWRALARRSGQETLGRGLRYARAVMDSSAVRPLLAAGLAAQVLCECSPGAEMVVAGSRGQGGLSGLLLGSVSLTVAAHARGLPGMHLGSVSKDVLFYASCPVSVVHPH